MSRADDNRFSGCCPTCHQPFMSDALGTNEYGEELLEVARNAHRAEQELAALKRKLEEEFDGEVDITSTGGPNAAMRVMMIVKGER